MVIIMTLHLSVPLTIISALALVSMGIYYYQTDNNKSPDNTLKVDSLTKNVLYLAHGNEPFWNASINKNHVVFTTPNQKIRLDVNHDSSKKEMTLLGDHADKAFSLVITSAACNDTSQNKTHPLTVKISFDGAQYLGCAWQP